MLPFFSFPRFLISFYSRKFTNDPRNFHHFAQFLNKNEAKPTLACAFFFSAFLFLLFRHTRSPLILLSFSALLTSSLVCALALGRLGLWCSSCEVFKLPSNRDIILDCVQSELRSARHFRTLNTKKMAPNSFSEVSIS